MPKLTDRERSTWTRQHITQQDNHHAQHGTPSCLLMPKSLLCLVLLVGSEIWTTSSAFVATTTKTAVRKVSPFWNPTIGTPTLGSHSTVPNNFDADVFHPRRDKDDTFQKLISGALGLVVSNTTQVENGITHKSNGQKSEQTHSMNSDVSDNRKNDKLNSPYSSKVMQMLTETNWWNLISNRILSWLESTMIWLENQLEHIFLLIGTWLQSTVSFLQLMPTKDEPISIRNQMITPWDEIQLYSSTLLASLFSKEYSRQLPAKRKNSWSDGRILNSAIISKSHKHRFGSAHQVNIQLFPQPATSVEVPPLRMNRYSTLFSNWPRQYSTGRRLRKNIPQKRWWELDFISKARFNVQYMFQRIFPASMQGDSRLGTTKVPIVFPGMESDAMHDNSDNTTPTASHDVWGHKLLEPSPTNATAVVDAIINISKEGTVIPSHRRVFPNLTKLQELFPPHGVGRAGQSSESGTMMKYQTQSGIVDVTAEVTEVSDHATRLKYALAVVLKFLDTLLFKLEQAILAILSFSHSALVFDDHFYGTTPTRRGWQPMSTANSGNRRY